MKLDFKVSTFGNSQTKTSVDANGKTIAEKIKGALEDSIITVTGAKVLEKSTEQKERTIYMAAVFFQRVVSRTPVDEDYTFVYNGKELSHEKDDDVVREAWTISVENKTFTAKDFMTSGVTFDKFNDKGEIDTIYKALRENVDFRKKLNIVINNKHKRCAELEFGEYEKDGTIKRGEKYSHGVTNGYSVQAPYGMKRITIAECNQMKVSSSTEKLIKSYAQSSNRLKKVPSQSKMKRLKSLIKNKTHLSKNDIEAVEKVYE